MPCLEQILNSVKIVEFAETGVVHYVYTNPFIHEPLFKTK